MMTTQKKHLIILGGVVGLFLAFNVIGIILHLSPGPSDPWNKNVFPGKVTHISADALTIVNAQGTVRKFTLTPQSKYFSGRDQIIAAAVPVGQLVLVTVEVKATTTVRDIRVMKDGPKRLNR